MAETAARTAAPPHLVRRSWHAVRATLRRRDGLAVFVAVTVGYLFAYLFVTNNLIGGRGEFGLLVVESPLATALERESALSFRAVALVDLGPVRYLFSPVDSLVGLGLAALVGANLALSYVAWRQPTACGLGSRSAGLFAAFPALLSGTACCGPVLFIVLGIQTTGLVVAAFEFLLPVAALLLVGSLLLVGRRVDPTLV